MYALKDCNLFILRVAQIVETDVDLVGSPKGSRRSLFCGFKLARKIDDLRSIADIHLH